MTIAQAKKLHKELWLWLAENPGKAKWNWPKWDFNEGKIPKQIADCFACTLSSCCKTECLIVWPGLSCMDGKGKEDDKGLFAIWCAAPNKTERTRFARQIANLPWRENELP